MRIVSGKQINTDFLKDVVFLESLVYPKEYCGSVESIFSRYERFKDAFILAYEGNELIGYLCFFPISIELEDKLIEGKHFFDDDISPSDIVWYKTNNSLFLISIVVKPDFQRKGIAALLMNKAENYFKKNNKSINKLYATSINPISKYILEKNSFKVIKKINDNKIFEKYLMRRNLND